jgi:hypothetical protein
MKSWLEKLSFFSDDASQKLFHQAGLLAILLKPIAIVITILVAKVIATAITIL